jgi:hypothetical protein
MRRDGRFNLYEREFPSGAPLYMAYMGTPLYGRYAREFGTRSMITVTEYGTDGRPDWFTERESLELVDTITYPRAFFESVVASTDGILTFTPEVQTHEAMWALSKFKSKTGRFLDRRAKRFFAEKAAAGFSHFDDVGFAAVLL